MRRLVSALVLLSMIVVACGDDDAVPASTASTATTTGASTSTSAPADTTTTEAAQGFTAMSDDGRVTLAVPPEVMARDPGVVISAFDAAARPPELDGLPAQPWAYSLEPGALQFDAPVRMSVTIPYAEFEIGDSVDGVPVAMLVTTTADGDGWQLLDDQMIRRDGDSVTITGMTDHFSSVAVINEQVLIETRLVEIHRDLRNRFDVSFVGPGGIPLNAPDFGDLDFLNDGGLEIGVAGFEDDLALDCPPGVDALTGDLAIELLLNAASTGSGRAGLIGTPQVITMNDEAASLTVIRRRIQLVCRPTIAADGSVILDMTVDHPGGAPIIPGEDFRGGLSGLYLDLRGTFPTVRMGLIRDVNSNGVIDPDDIMYPTFPGEVVGESTSFVLPLFGFGDYFPYLIDSVEVTEAETEVLVKDGGTLVLEGLLDQGLGRQHTAVPFVGDVPLLARVFSEESRQIEEAEMAIFLTPRILTDTTGD